MLQDLAVRKQGCSRGGSPAPALSGASCSERKRERRERRERKGEEKKKKSREETEDIDNRDSSLGSSLQLSRLKHYKIPKKSLIQEGLMQIPSLNTKAVKERKERREKPKVLKKKNDFVEVKRSVVRRKIERKVDKPKKKKSKQIPPKQAMYYQPTPSTLIPPPVARLCRLANLERSLKQSLLMFEQQTTTAAAPGKSHECICTTCTRSALHARKVPFMLNTEYISTKKSRFKPTYIEFMEAKDEYDDIMPSHSPEGLMENPGPGIMIRPPMQQQQQGGSRGASPAPALSGSSCSERKRERRQKRERKGEEKKKKRRGRGDRQPRQQFGQFITTCH